MNETSQKLFKALELEDFDYINDFLIEISGNPRKEDLKFIDLLLKLHYKDLWNNYMINLIYYLGELGSEQVLDEKYIILMNDIYFQSDRWVRNEILVSILKLIEKNDSKEFFSIIINNAISDEYLPIKLNSLKILKRFDSLSREMLTKVLITLTVEDPEIVMASCQVIKKNISSNESLIRILGNLTLEVPIIENSLIRNLLTNLFNSVIKLEQFRDDLADSNLSENLKKRIIQEIAIMQKILLKSSTR